MPEIVPTLSGMTVRLAPRLLHLPEPEMDFRITAAEDVGSAGKPAP